MRGYVITLFVRLSRFLLTRYLKKFWTDFNEIWHYGIGEQREGQVRFSETLAKGQGHMGQKNVTKRF